MRDFDVVIASLAWDGCVLILSLTVVSIDRGSCVVFTDTLK